ncbi:MAG: ABC transporter permease subunit, partial [Christensenellaceae bacterium]
MDSFLKLVAELSSGLGITLSLFALTLLISIPLGFLGSQVSLSKHKFTRGIYGVYLVLMRGTPLILQVLFMYFGLNLLGIPIGRFESALLSFVLNYTAY